MNLTQVWQVTHFIPTGYRRRKGVRQLGRNFLKSPNPSEPQNRRGLIHIPHTLTVKSTPKSEEEIIAGWKRVQRIFQLLRSEMTTRLGDDRWYWVIIPQVFLTIQQYQTFPSLKRYPKLDSDLEWGREWQSWMSRWSVGTWQKRKF